jgi:hypothetical protein
MKLQLFLGLLAVMLRDAHSQTADSLRLTGTGALNDRGRLEIFHDGVWGTVCDDSFDNVDATVACYQLGFGYQGSVYEYGDSFGDGTGQIWMDETACNGDETTLAACSHNTWGVHDCSHAEDVAILCGSGITTTLAPVDIRRSFLELWLDGALTATSGSLSGTCQNQYTNQFRATLKNELAVVKQNLPSLCPLVTSAVLSVAYVNLFTSAADVSLTYGVYLATNGRDTMADLEYCGVSIRSYLSNFSNWNQPIFPDISGCSSLAFSSTEFQQSGIKWVCPSPLDV